MTPEELAKRFPREVLEAALSVIEALQERRTDAAQATLDQDFEPQ